MHEVNITIKHRQNYNKPGGLNEMWNWAVAHFGYSHPDIRISTTDTRWYFDTYHTFFFRDEVDAVLFTLKWL